MEFSTVLAMLLSLEIYLLVVLMLMQCCALLLLIVAELLSLLFFLILVIASLVCKALAVLFLTIGPPVRDALVACFLSLRRAISPPVQPREERGEPARVVPASWLRHRAVENLDDPTFAELSELGYDSLLPGKQCTHAVKDWFRGGRRIRRSRDAIFREIIATSGIEASEKDRLTSSYLSGENLTVARPPPPTFSKFRELPPELRVIICREAARIPRLVNVASITGWPPARGVDRAPPMPKPEIAHATLELQYETRRHHGRAFSTSFEHQPGELAFFAEPGGPVERLVGFVRPRDTLYYGVLDSRATPAVVPPPPQPGKDICHPRDLARTVGSTSVACWWNPEVFTFQWDPLGSGLDLDEMGFVQTWSFLRDIPSLETLWISWIGASPGCETHSRCGEDGIAIRCRTSAGDDENFQGESRIRVVVPLFDDRRIAEVLSLDSHVWDCEKAFHTVHSRLGRHCLHCERARFQETYRALFPLLWVMLWIEELPVVQRWDVVKSPRELNMENDWVKAKLASMPVIKPYMSFQLFPQTDEEEKEVEEVEEEDPYEYEGNEEESVFDYTSVSYRTCSIEARGLYARHYETPEYPQEPQWDRAREPW